MSYRLQKARQMKKLLLILLLSLFFIALSNAEEIEIPPLIIKGRDISPFPSSPLLLSPGLLREEKEEKEIPREDFFPLRIKGQLWKGKEGYAEIEGGGGSYGSYRTKFLGIVKGKSNSLIFQYLKEGRDGYREKGWEEGNRTSLLFLFPKGKIKGEEEKSEVNLLGPLGKGKVGKRSICAPDIEVKLGEEELNWGIKARNFLIKEDEEKFSGGERSIYLYHRGESSSSILGVREEFLRDSYDIGEGEFSYSSLSPYWGIKGLIQENSLSFFPQYSYTRPLSESLNLSFSLEGEWNKPDILSMYKLSGVGIREKFLSPEKHWKCKGGVEGDNPFSYSFHLSYERIESILSWEKDGNLWEPTSISSANFIGLEGKFQRRIKENLVWEGRGIYREEVCRRRIPYFIYSRIETSLLREKSKTKEEISLQYHGPRYFERGSKRQLEGFTKIEANLETSISSRMSVAFYLAYILDCKGELFKGYPIAPWEYFISLTLNW